MPFSHGDVNYASGHLIDDLLREGNRLRSRFSSFDPYSVCHWVVVHSEGAIGVRLVLTIVASRPCKRVVTARIASVGLAIGTHDPACTTIEVMEPACCFADANRATVAAVNDSFGKLRHKNTFNTALSPSFCVLLCAAFLLRTTPHLAESRTLGRRIVGFFWGVEIWLCGGIS